MAQTLTLSARPTNAEKNKTDNILWLASNEREPVLTGGQYHEQNTVSPGHKSC
ncbi:hypothetical protein AEGHOMDF_4675 [Methylobacterium soli]|nr:hypothetical protein AEGHOMDF_4675 [Methylobacterium soli]